MPKGRFGKDLTGQKPFKILWIEKSNKRSTDNRALWRCLCDCGKELFLPGHFLKSQQSCGCIREEEYKRQLETGLKWCNDCKYFKPVEQFYTHSSKKDGRNPYCIEHSKLRANIWRKYNPNKAKSSDLKKRYGITLEQKHDMLAKQDGKCAACGTTKPGGKYNDWSVDHDHETKEVRSILCAACNSSLGFAEENIEHLLALVAYIKLHKTSTDIKS